MPDLTRLSQPASLTLVRRNAPACDESTGVESSNDAIQVITLPGGTVGLAGYRADNTLPLLLQYDAALFEPEDIAPFWELFETALAKLNARALRIES